MTALDPTRPAAPAAPGSPGSPAARGRTPGGPGAVLALTSVAVFVVFLDTTIVNVAFEAIGRDFHAGVADLSWIINAYSLVFAALLLPVGRLADLYGRRRLFLVGLVVFAVTSALCGLAPGVGWLVAARVLQAVGAALIVPTSLSLLLPEFPPERRATAVGTWGAMGAVAAASGPTLGALLVQYADWRWVFLVNVPLCAGAAWLGRTVLREQPREPGTRFPDPLGVLLSMAAPGLVSLAIVQGPDWGWGSTRIVLAFVGGAVALAAFVWRCRRAAAPVLDLELFGSASFSLANLGVLLFAVAFFGATLAGIVFLQSVWGYPVLRAALAVTPSPVTAAILARPAGRVADRFGHRVALVPGALLVAAGLALYAARVGAVPHYAADWLPSALLVGAGIGLAFPTLGSAAAASLPPARYAVGSAVNSTFRQLGAVLGVSVFVAVLGHPTPLTVLADFHRVWHVLAAAAGACALVCLFIRTRERTTS